MSDSADPPSSGPEPEVHWALHLREDLRDIRSEVRGLHSRIDDTNALTNARFEALSTRLESHLRWTMMAMIAMTGVIAALIKL